MGNFRFGTNLLPSNNLTSHIKNLHCALMGLPGLEPGTSRLSGVRSHQLSYRPAVLRTTPLARPTPPLQLPELRSVAKLCPRRQTPRGLPPLLPRKEVIQPQVLLRLPCYDFTPIAGHTFGACPLRRLARQLRVHPTFVV